MHLSLHKQFPLLCLFWLPLFASLSCLISALTQGGEGGHLFRLTCSVVLWGGRNTANKYYWHVWGSARSLWTTVGLPPFTACVLSRSTLLRLQVALQGNCLTWALGCMHFSGLSHSGSGSWVHHKGADLVGPAYCALPCVMCSSHDQVFGECTLSGRGASYHLPGPSLHLKCAM